MRPNKQLKLQTSLFSSPYAPQQPASQLSPVPADTHTASSSAASQHDPTTPLLPPTPSMAEKGGGFPFPSDSRHHGRWRGVLGGRSVGARRLVPLAVLVLLTILLLRGSPLGVSADWLWTDQKVQSDAQLLPEKTESAEASRSSSTPGWRLPPVFPKRPTASYTSGSAPIVPPGVREIDFYSEALPVEATLRERLDVWRNAPGGRGEVEGEVEMGGFVQWNLEVSPGRRSCVRDVLTASNATPSQSSTTHI